MYRFSYRLATALLPERPQIPALTWLRLQPRHAIDVLRQIMVEFLGQERINYARKRLPA
jgi:hypothetical protein